MMNVELTEKELLDERILAYNEREQDPESRYQKLKTFLSINGYNVGHLLKLEEKHLIEHAEACRDSFKMSIERRDDELLRLRAEVAELRRDKESGILFTKDTAAGMAIRVEDVMNIMERLLDGAAQTTDPSDWRRQTVIIMARERNRHLQYVIDRLRDEEPAAISATTQEGGVG